MQPSGSAAASGGQLVSARCQTTLVARPPFPERRHSGRFTRYKRHRGQGGAAGVELLEFDLVSGVLSQTPSPRVTERFRELQRRTALEHRDGVFGRQNSRVAYAASFGQPCRADKGEMMDAKRRLGLAKRGMTASETDTVQSWLQTHPCFDPSS
jgi:hypothetical protein